MVRSLYLNSRRLNIFHLACITHCRCIRSIFKPYCFTNIRIKLTLNKDSGGDAVWHQYIVCAAASVLVVFSVPY